MPPLVARKISRDYAKALNAYLKACTELKSAKTALVALLVERRLRGDSNKSIAAEFGLTEQFVNRRVVESTEYQSALAARREAKRAAEDERYAAWHAAWVKETRRLIEKADAGVDVDDLAAEFGMTAQRVREAIEQCRWVFHERDFPMLAEQCLR
jgi:uncharacterized protein (DUF433 family)